ncbi:MAG: transporter [Salinivirgaceae bacterium]|jgi:TolB protein|nr:transporter [Salinivirgaceae bacterium]
MKTKTIIEILNIQTGSREIVWEDSDHLEAPNWSKDEYLLVNGGGKLYRIYLNNPRKEVINTDFATTCNNDHGISPDGSHIVISHEDGDKSKPLAWQSSKIYTLPINGGIPKLITSTNSSFWHGWSPDGKTLVYTALRKGQWDIYSIPAKGGEETQLTNSPKQHDGAEYAPNGKYIYYNSYDSGIMELWRMRADGSEQTQITDDKHSNWFPHFSPDNKKMVYLCYIKDQGEGHPFGQQVKLRIQDLETEQITDITDEFFGGQGTINVNSWSPDSKHIAYVRYI